MAGAVSPRAGANGAGSSVDSTMNGPSGALRDHFGGGLQPIAQATTVDATGDTPILTDGPYAESKEYLGGFWVIQAPDLDAALDWAKQASAACRGRVEVRPFQGE